MKNWLLLLLILPGTFLTGKAQEKTVFPVPIRIEGEEIRSELLIEVNFLEYKQNLSKFKKKNENGNHGEDVLISILQAIINNDLGTYKELTTSKDNSPGEEFEIYRYFASDMTEPEILFRFDIGDLSIFYVDVQHQKYPFIALGLIRKGNSYKNSFPVLNHPVCESISSVARGLVNNPGSIKAIRNPDKSTQVETGNLFNSKTSPVRYHFNGDHAYVNIKNLADTANYYPEEMETLVTSYAESMNYLKNMKKQKFYATLGDRSRSKVKQLFNTKSPAEQQEFARVQTMNQKIRYIMDLDPVYVLAYDQTRKTKGSLSMAFLLQKDGDYHLVNMLMLSFINKLLEQPGFIDEIRKEE